APIEALFGEPREEFEERACVALHWRAKPHGGAVA
ncbi:MAG: hypothetical protein QOG93_382, partial [Gaiellaceae bacterium]|nr:hypothetical protein [Gaiellaceae bacterium]